MSWHSADRTGGGEIPLHADTVAFVRSGLLEGVDSNYFLASSGLIVCAPAAGEEGSCTIFRFNPGTISQALLGTGLLVALSSPWLFLRQWQILRLARSGRAEAPLIERAASGMIDEVRAALVRAQQHHIQHAELIDAIKSPLRSGAVASARLDRLASAFGMSPFTVSRAFHRDVGISIRQYGKRLRLRRALQLMFDTQDDLSSIATDVGFFDQAHFTNAFRQDFGVPPSLVRASRQGALHTFGCRDADEVQHFGDQNAAYD